MFHVKHPRTALSGRDEQLTGNNGCNSAMATTFFTALQNRLLHRFLGTTLLV